jgi:2-dehydro-3-deoxyphosphogluconate aldolase/(4S)-4-hydroxy-2-oxoglutarate aldolase
MDASACLAGIRLMPVLVLQDAATAITLGGMLKEVGFPALEVTLRTPEALACLAALAKAYPTLRVGAGSLRQAGQFSAVKAAGAAFAVAPGHSETLLQAAAHAGMPFIPGAATGSEMLRLLDAGYTLQKFFPAETLGGAAAIKSYAAPLPEVRFFPTGGITAATLPAYLALPAVATVGGSWFLSASDLSAGHLEAVAESAQVAWSLAHG